MRKSSTGNPVGRVSQTTHHQHRWLSGRHQTPVSSAVVMASLQKEAKENAGILGGKADAATPASSTSNSTLTSPRLSLSPRVPSNSAGNPVRRSSSSRQRLGSGLLRQLDVSKSLQADSSHGAESSEPTSPSGSVASEAASVASESALLRRRGGKQAMSLQLGLPECMHSQHSDRSSVYTTTTSSLHLS